MERIAIFVEGQTERIFVENLLHALAGHRNYHIDAIQAFGGGPLLPRTWEEIHATRPDPKIEYYILIYECMNDSRVLSDIRDQYQTLVDQGFKTIIGIRDVYPEPPADIPTIRADFISFIPAGPVVPVLILEIMEIEAWFIGEHTHFPHIHACLTPPAVTAALGYDPSAHDVTTIAWPCQDIRTAYALAGRGYNKSRRHVERTVGVLSYEDVYMNLRKRIVDLDSLIMQLEAFFV